MTRTRVLAAVVAALVAAGCGKPGVGGLRESFAQQLAANTFVKDFTRSGDDLRFSGPDVKGGLVKWKIHIDSAVIEPHSEAGKPYKGVVKSSWYANDQIVRPSGGDSNLPLELSSTGLAQDCWAIWDEAARKWGWE
jgi:hypothetical protein